MKEPQTIKEYTTEIISSVVAFIKCSKIYLILAAFVSWFFSTYPIEKILLFFFIMTCLDTITKIHAIAKKKKIKFNPFKKIFWLQIESQGLKLMGRKIFLDYSIPIMMVFFVDTLIFKNAIHFNVLSLNLSPPAAAILFFGCVEFWSIFENIEEAGGVNWLKKASNWFSGFLPEKWQNVLDKILNKKDEV
jgi:hypothetical protein